MENGHPLFILISQNDGGAALYGLYLYMHRVLYLVFITGRFAGSKSTAWGAVKKWVKALSELAPIFIV